ncbi:MAG: hypothetical protein ACKPB3_08830, partial [Bacteroidota bacterium]
GVIVGLWRSDSSSFKSTSVIRSRAAFFGRGWFFLKSPQKKLLNLQSKKNQPRPKKAARLLMTEVDLKEEESLLQSPTITPVQFKRNFLEPNLKLLRLLLKRSQLRPVRL